MKRGFLIGLLFVLLTLFAVGAVAAIQSDEPVLNIPDVVLHDQDGTVVGFIWYVGSTTYARIYEESFAFCNCEGVICEIIPTPPPTDTPGDPTPTPTDPTPTPVPTEKPKCNRGGGNGSEDCDPGNSSGQGGGNGRPAGEDRGEYVPGRGN